MPWRTSPLAELGARFRLIFNGGGLCYFARTRRSQRPTYSTGGITVNTPTATDNPSSATAASSQAAAIYATSTERNPSNGAAVKPHGKPCTLLGRIAGAISRNIPIIPIPAGEKRSILIRWPELATTDRAKLEEWNLLYSDCNYGCVANAESPDGVCILDTDSPGLNLGGSSARKQCGKLTH
jgi:Bifunctional DNA primase/polymerase, N-terminal